MNMLLEGLKRITFQVAKDIELLPLDSGGDFSAEPGDFMSSLITILVSIGAFLAFILIVVGGYKFMTSGGDVNKVKDGKEQIQNAILGLLLILLSVGITYMIFTVFGITEPFKFSQETP